ATFGGATAAVVKQGRPENLFGKFAATINVGGSEPTAAQLGANFPDVWFVYDYFYKAYRNAMNDRFVAAYQKAYGEAPDSWAYEGYATIYALRTAIDKAKSADVDKLIAALEGATVETPKGRLQYRPDHELSQPVTVFECKGDAAAAHGYVCPRWDAIPAEKVK
ncbi:MAG: ABC transporter substrate-binding protein, partial [bacterium]|nr:ABC transporter substrate-binding protein [bacterium]